MAVVAEQRADLLRPCPLVGQVTEHDVADREALVPEQNALGRRLPSRPIPKSVLLRADEVIE